TSTGSANTALPAPECVEGARRLIPRARTHAREPMNGSRQRNQSVTVRTVRSVQTVCLSVSNRLTLFSSARARLSPARVRAGKQSDRPGLRKRCMENRLGHGWDNRRRSTPRIRQQFEVYNHDSLSRLVDRPVRDIARLEEIVSLLVYR